MTDGGGDEKKTIRLLIEKPAVVFIGEARENQLPISFRENSCQFVGKLFLFIPIRGPLHSTVTDLARFLGRSTLQPRNVAIW